jgi:hypothetical protein
MRLKNYNEDLVLDTLKIVLKDRTDIKQTKSFMLDVAAYTLNRIPSKYITSERGFTRELIQSAVEDEEERLVNIIELIALINRGIDVVSKRRKNHRVRQKLAPSEEVDDVEVQLTYFYNLPHIFGRIVNSHTGSPVISAKVSLFVNNTLSVPAEPGWENPYRTNEQTKGYFSFWPQPEMGSEDSLKVEFSIGFSHKEYKSLTFRKTLKVPGEFFVSDFIRGDKVLDVGTLALEPLSTA